MSYSRQRVNQEGTTFWFFETAAKFALVLCPAGSNLTIAGSKLLAIQKYTNHSHIQGRSLCEGWKSSCFYSFIELVVPRVGESDKELGRGTMFPRPYALRLSLLIGYAACGQNNFICPFRSLQQEDLEGAMKLRSSEYPCSHVSQQLLSQVIRSKNTLQGFPRPLRPPETQKSLYPRVS